MREIIYLLPRKRFLISDCPSAVGGPGFWQVFVLCRGRSGRGGCWDGLGDGEGNAFCRMGCVCVGCGSSGGLVVDVGCGWGGRRWLGGFGSGVGDWWWCFGLGITCSPQVGSGVEDGKVLCFLDDFGVWGQMGIADVGRLRWTCWRRVVVSRMCMAGNRFDVRNLESGMLLGFAYS